MWTENNPPFTDIIRSIDLHFTVIEHCKFNSPENVYNFQNRNWLMGKDITGLFTSEDVYCCMTIKTLLMTNCPSRIGNFITCEPTCKSFPVMTKPATHTIVCKSLPLHLSQQHESPKYSIDHHNKNTGDYNHTVKKW